MRILITGVGGFVGKHLVNYLSTLPETPELHGTLFRERTSHPLADMVSLHTLDLKDEQAVFELIDTVRPDQIYHLAAQAFVPRSFTHPWETLENNIKSQLNILEACKKLELKPHILVISSAEVYGRVKPDQIPLNEQTKFNPNSPYGVSKITQEMLGFQYAQAHGIPIMCARPFNHIGTGQREDFVAPAFAMQIARIEAGLQDPIMKVGDLSAKRDFTDVRDIVRAYHAIVTKGKVGTSYTVASGKAYPIQQLLDTLIALSTMSSSIQVQPDPARMRPSPVPILQGSYELLHQDTGWQPEITFEQTLADILDECRERIKNEGVSQ